MVRLRAFKAGIVGTFNNKQITKTIGIPGNYDTFLIMPIGFPG